MFSSRHRLIKAAIAMWSRRSCLASFLIGALLCSVGSAQELELQAGAVAEQFLENISEASTDDLLAAAADSQEPLDTASELTALRRRLGELERAEQKRTATEAKKSADEKVKKEEEARKIDDWLDVSTDKWTVKLGGHVQMDYVNWINPDHAITGPAAGPGTQDYFEFRRLRLVADGTGYGVYDFRLQMTLEPETVGESPAGTVTSPEVKDAYFSINELPWLGRMRIGNFFVPFSLEQVTNDTNNIFMERSIPSQGIFAADREVGVAFYNCSTDQRITWTTGAFFDSINDSLKERIDDRQGYRLSGRATWLPYYDEPSNGRYLVHTGAGILHTDDQDDRVRFRARPQIREGPRIIDSGVLSADSYTTGNLEMAVVWGQFTLQSEMFLSNVNMLAGDAQQVHGGYAHVSYFLTGENRIFEKFGQHGPQFGRNAPFTNVFATPGGRGLGAWEAKARWSNLNLNGVNRGEYNDLTVGCNWYWSDRVRVMLDWIHPVTSGQTTFGSTNSDLLATRFDFNW